MKNMECNASEDAESELILSKHNFGVKIGETHFSLDKDIKINISVRKDSLKNLLISNYYSTNFDNLVENNDDKFIYLAKMKVIVDGANYYIDDFVKHPAHQYMLNNELLELIQNLEHSSYNIIKADEKSLEKEVKKVEEVESKTLIEKVKRRRNVNIR